MLLDDECVTELEKDELESVAEGSKMKLDESMADELETASEES